jgi:hypothetical protein
MKTMKRSFVVFPLIFLLLVIFRNIHQAAAPSSEEKNYEFINGQWFDGKDFGAATFYSVGRIFSAKKPGKVDKVIDLKGGYVVPPFGDAHNHYISGPNKIDEILQAYLKDGIFYAKNPASIYRDTEQIKDKINKPQSVDIVFSNAALTASGAHPVKLYEVYLKKVKKPGPDGTFENLAYIILDNESDLEKKWPLIMKDHPDFLKVHLLYSEEFEKRRNDPAYYGDRGMDPKLLPLIVAKAHAAHLRVSCHIETATDFRNALAAGIDEINHMPGYYPDFAHPDWFVITKQDAELAARKGVVVVTTTYVSAAELKDENEKKRAQEIQSTNLQLLHDAGVSIAIGPDVYGVTSLQEAMNLYHMKVFDNLTLLKMWCETTAATIFPSRKIGKLKDGYEASFLVLEGNPIENFDNVTKIRMRLKQGEFLQLDSAQ